MPIKGGMATHETAAPPAGYTIDYSCRFNRTDNPYLNRTFSAGDTKTWTLSCWVKKIKTGSTYTLFSTVGDGSSRVSLISFENEALKIITDSGVETNLVSTSVYRDPSAWMHVQIIYDTTQATAADRVRIYINGVQLTDFTTSTYPIQNAAASEFNSALTHGIGRFERDAINYFDGYMAEIHFVDGTAVDVTDFGELVNGRWIAKEYTGSYGTNGFYLDFADNSNFGNDVSGNNNDFTGAGITGVDQLTDTPTNNHCTLNPVDTGSTGTLSDGLLVVSGGNAKVTMRPSSGEWYYEKDGVGVSYDADVSGQFNPTLTAGTYNFGQSAWAGVGPSGAEKAINANNLPTPAIADGADMFVTAADSETNITSALATARSGWTDYVDILKNRDTAETWAWRFSHDSGNEYAVSSTATRQVNRSLSGTDGWIGYSLRIGSTYGTAAGSQAHTNGVATTVTHNLGEARCSIFLFPRSGGNVLVYHPDLSTGDLLYLTTNDVEFASSIITNVGANSFDIGSTAATDTYDYLVLTEKEGSIALGIYAGNSSTDGVFSYCDHLSRLTFVKNRDAFFNWFVWDTERSVSNLTDDNLKFNLTNAETVNSTSNNFDLLSNGIKPRTSDNATNRTGDNYVYWSIAELPFKYANAR